MPLKRVALMMPCYHLEDLSRGLVGEAAAEMLSAWTTLWHPALVGTTGELPGWHSVSEPPDPGQLEGELIVVPPVSRERLPADWWEQMTSTFPRNPPPVLATASRAQTIVEALNAAGLLAKIKTDDNIVGDFLALGFAHLQLELLTRAMRYNTVLDAHRFRECVVDAARAAVAGESARAHDLLLTAFDLLADARNHFYAVDFYIVDVTLLAESTPGAALREKLSAPQPTNLLTTVSLVEQLALDEETHSAVRVAVERGTTSIVQGPRQGATLAHRDPEGILAEIKHGRDVFENLLNVEPTLYGQFGNSYSPLLPEILLGLGYQGVLYTTFDGSRVERPSQPRAKWGARNGTAIEMLSTMPLNIADAGTWLTFGEYLGETLMRDHVATILLAGWPGHHCEYYGDLRRIAAFGPLFGSFITLDNYFRLADGGYSSTAFHPPQYPPPTSETFIANPIAARVATSRARAASQFDDLQRGLAELVVKNDDDAVNGLAKDAKHIALNPWTTTTARFVGVDPLDFAPSASGSTADLYLPDVPGLGYAVLDGSTAAPPAPLVDGRTLRNELIEVVISEATGGIQSLRTHRDRRTRVSQRLVMHDRRLPQELVAATMDAQTPQLTARMVADRVDVSRNDRFVGEITSHGQLVDVKGATLAHFTQRSRVVRGLPVAIVDVRLEPELAPEGDPWNSYYASRLAWRDEAVTVRCDVDWTARETSRRRIESPNWIEMSDAVGPMTCFALGLPYHRLASDTWLDTIVHTAGATLNQFQFAIGLNCLYPTQLALALMTASRPAAISLATRPPAPRGWFLHVSAKNIIVTHLELLNDPNRKGVRLRLLETEGRGAATSIAAFRAFRAARRTNLLGQVAEALTVVDGKLEIEIGPYRWVQIEAEW